MRLPCAFESKVPTLLSSPKEDINLPSARRQKSGEASRRRRQRPRRGSCGGVLLFSPSPLPPTSMESATASLVLLLVSSKRCLEARRRRKRTSRTPQCRERHDRGERPSRVLNSRFDSTDRAFQGNPLPKGKKKEKVEKGSNQNFASSSRGSITTLPSLSALALFSLSLSPLRPK